MKYYQDLITLAYPIPEIKGDSHFIEHHDGSVSCAVSWSGIDYDGIDSDKVLEEAFYRLHRMLSKASSYLNLTIENHFFRSHKPELLDYYLEYGERHIRSDREPEFAMHIRKCIADHLRDFSVGNDIFIVFTLSNRFSLLSKKNKKSIEKRKKELDEIILELTAYLSDSRLLTVDEYYSLVCRIIDPEKYRLNNQNVKLNRRFHINHLLNKPFWDGDCIVSKGIYNKVVVLYDYPDAKPDFFSFLSAQQGGVNVHCSQAIKPLDTNIVTNTSARDTEKSGQAASLAGGESVMGKISDHNNFRHYVQDNDLTIHASVYIITLSSDDKERVLIAHRKLCETLSLNTTYDTNNENIERLYWRISIPSQGYLSPFMRPDHHWQVAHMSPVFRQSNNDIKNAQLVNLTRTGTIVGYNYPRGGVHHSIQAAKTASGKSVDKCAQIAQLYPLGFNFYVTEVGRSYEWIIKAFGGDYFVLDTEKTVISPFPQYKSVIKAKDLTNDKSICDDRPLAAELLGPTIDCILPILLDRSDYSKMEGLTHYKSAVEDVLQIMYWDEMVDNEKSGPTLDGFLEIGRACIEMELISKVKHEYLEKILNNLESFLDRKEGSVFKRSDTIDFSKGLVGIDFSQLTKTKNHDLAKYLLVFIVNRFTQLAFLNKEPTFICNDEYHEFVDIDPYLCKDMERIVTRMGRKDACYFDAISQEVKDMAHLPNSENVDKALLNQITHVRLMFYGKAHGDLPELFQLPKNAEKVWKSYCDPKVEKYNYRQCLYMIGSKWWDLYLTWPKILNLLTDSDPHIRELKDKITEEGGNIFDWLTKLEERLEEVCS